MPPNSRPLPASVHQRAFGHYLRTGERLTNGEWLSRYERKFNPYHDELGRFTSPPGVTVSWGKYGGPRDGSSEGRGSSEPFRKVAASSRGRRTDPRQAQGAAAGSPAPKADAVPSTPDHAPNGFRSEFVRTAVSPTTSTADTYFELNKRQAHLDRLREEAGPNPPTDVREDLEDFQKRLDDNRTLLDERSLIADRETAEILRAGLAPFDFAAGATNIGAGEGEFRDYLSVVGAVPIAGGIRRLDWLVKLPRTTAIIDGARVEIVQLGGAHWKVRMLPGYHSHHMPSNMVSPLRRGEGPAIAMLPRDHAQTLSYGWGAAKIAHRRAQRELIAKGDFRGAIQLDVDDIRANFGTRYDKSIDQMWKYVDRKGF